MTEEQLLSEVVKMAHQRQIHIAHLDDSRRNPLTKGMPDCILIGKYHLIWRELKVRGNELNPNQTMWKYLLIQTGQDFKIWTEYDLWNGTIARELEALNQP